MAVPINPTSALRRSVAGVGDFNGGDGKSGRALAQKRWHGDGLDHERVAGRLRSERHAARFPRVCLRPQHSRHWGFLTYTEIPDILLRSGNFLSMWEMNGSQIQNVF